MTKRGLGSWRGSVGHGLPSTAVLGADVSRSSSLDACLLSHVHGRQILWHGIQEVENALGGRDLRKVQCSNCRESRSKGFQPWIDRQGCRGPRPLDDPWRLQDWPTASLLHRDGLHWSTPLATKRFRSTVARREPAIPVVTSCRLNSFVVLAIPSLRRRFVQSHQSQSICARRGSVENVERMKVDQSQKCGAVKMTSFPECTSRGLSSQYACCRVSRKMGSIFNPLPAHYAMR